MNLPSSRIPRTSSFATILLILFLLGSAPALSQDLNTEPLYGSSTLASGFIEDPLVVILDAGGPDSVALLNSECLGYISNDQADYVLRYEAGNSELGFFVDSDIDTTLIINDPRGNWQCNDDADVLPGTNAGISFNTPVSGAYHIWVGSYSSSDTGEPARLIITEEDAQDWSSLNLFGGTQSSDRIASEDIDFGDNSSDWAGDGECDDPRFAGRGMASTLLEEDRLHDADDCRELFSQGAIGLVVDMQGSSLGRIERGELTRSDLTQADGSYVDVFSFSGSAGDLAILELRSGSFDTVLTVRTPLGQEFVNDDYNGDSGRSMLTLTLEETGSYQASVSSFAERETGDYTLTIQSEP